ncbi:MAG: sigma-70 family RNA polymerase sigma factor [Gemmataceae bacterium]|nr:sigma-70 family RNA polymerase sigma factor [Gemmataceae bacterium]
MSEPTPSLNTNDLVFWVTELQAGRPNAAEPTFKKIVARVGDLARASFKKFPRVGRFVDLDDVIQNSLIRLLAAFREVRPTSRRHFYALANELIRRELLDLAKHFYGPRGAGTNLAVGVIVGDESGEVTPAAADPGAELDRLAAFHRAVEKLPVEEREAVGLTYYHGWTQAQVADLFGVSVRTVQRWLDSATEMLRAAAK